MLEGLGHEVVGEGTQLRAGGHQLLERRGVARVVAGLHGDVRLGGGRFDDRLVLRRQGVERLVIDHDVQLRAAFPPAGVVVVGRDLVEAELQVVVRTHPFGGVDGALFERLVDLAAGDVLRHAAHALDHLAREAADAELQALHVGGALDFLAVPAAHLRAGVAAGEVDDVVLGVELAHQLQAVALVHPRGHLPAVQAEGDGATEREHLVLAEEVVGRGVRHFHGALLHAVDHAEGGHQLAGRVGADLELAARHRLHPGGEDLGAAVDGVQRLGEAGGEAPADGGLRVHRGGDAGGKHSRDACILDDGTTVHGEAPRMSISVYCVPLPSNFGVGPRRVAHSRNASLSSARGFPLTYGKRGDARRPHRRRGDDLARCVGERRG